MPKEKKTTGHFNHEFVVLFCSTDKESLEYKYENLE